MSYRAPKSREKCQNLIAKIEQAHKKTDTAPGLNHAAGATLTLCSLWL